MNITFEELKPALDVLKKINAMNLRFKDKIVGYINNENRFIVYSLNEGKNPIFFKDDKSIYNYLIKKDRLKKYEY